MFYIPLNSPQNISSKVKSSLAMQGLQNGESTTTVRVVNYQLLSVMLLKYHKGQLPVGVE